MEQIMKKSIIFLWAAATSLFAACSIAEPLSEEQLAPTVKTVNVHFTAENTETKTAFGEFDENVSAYPALWTGNDQYIAMSMNYGEIVEAEVIKDEPVSNKAEFSAVFEDSGAPYQFFAISPLSAIKKANESRENLTVVIPTVQTPKADGLSCDEAAMILWARTEELPAIPEMPVQLHFEHVTAYCRLILKNLSTAFASNNIAGATIKSVDVTYSAEVAGEWYYSPTEDFFDSKDGSHTITLLPTISDLSQPAELWFALAPTTLSGETVKVSVNTNKGRISRTYTFGKRTYAPGSVNKLTLDMTKDTTFEEFTTSTEETVYQLVNSLNDLSVNDEVIFVDTKSPSYAMTATTEGTNGFKSVAKDATTGFTYSTEDGYIRLPENSSVAVLKVATKSGTTLTFGCGSQFVQRNTTGQTHYLYLSSSAREFTTSISGGAATLSYLSNSRTTTYSVYYNNSHFNIFSSRSSATRSIAIYKKKTLTIAGDLDPDNDPILEKEQYGAYLASGDIIYAPFTSQLSRELANQRTTFAILYPTDQEILEISGIPNGAAKDDSFTIVAVSVNGRRRTTLGTFKVTVVKEDGPKLWLSDFDGNGFIVKR